jgi:hypothetical protein
MMYIDMTPEQKREYGFVKLTQRDLERIGFKLGRLGVNLFFIENHKEEIIGFYVP